MPVIKIRSRLAPATPATASATTGKPSALAGGELAYNSAGMNLIDKQNGGALYIGDGKRVVTLVSSDRQVERIGNQTIQGVKTFVDGVVLGTNGPSLPIVTGNDQEFMRLDTASNTVIWDTADPIVIHNKILTGTTGDVVQNFNADTAGITIASQEIWMVTDTESRKIYVWSGGEGSFGTAAGNIPVTSAMLVNISVIPSFATVADVQIGNGADKIISPQVANTEIFLKNTPSGPQTVTVPLTTFKEAVAADGNGKVAFESDVTWGATGAPITITANAGSTLTGTPTDPLNIQDVIIDCGTY